MKDRPWIWIVIGYIAFVIVMLATVTISVKYGPREIPLAHGHK